MYCTFVCEKKIYISKNRECDLDKNKFDLIKWDTDNETFYKIDNKIIKWHPFGHITKYLVKKMDNVLLGGNKENIW